MTIPSEHQEQVNFVNWMEYNYPEHRLFSTLNGAFFRGTNEQKAKQINFLKAEGFRNGVPDLMIPSLFLFIEMKKTGKSSTSKEQKEWIKHLDECGYTAVICKGADEAKDVVTKILTGQSS